MLRFTKCSCVYQSSVHSSGTLQVPVSGPVWQGEIGGSKTETVATSSSASPGAWLLYHAGLWASTHLMVPESRTGSWGTTENLDRSSSRLILQMSTPSMRIRPAAGSTRRKRATPKEDFPVGQETSRTSVPGSVLEAAQAIPALVPALFPSVVPPLSPESTEEVWSLCSKWCPKPRTAFSQPRPKGTNGAPD